MENNSFKINGRIYLDMRPYINGKIVFKWFSNIVGTFMENTLSWGMNWNKMYTNNKTIDITNVIKYMKTYLSHNNFREIFTVFGLSLCNSIGQFLESIKVIKKYMEDE